VLISFFYTPYSFQINHSHHKIYYFQIEDRREISYKRI
jgi:hypothetical protein